MRINRCSRRALCAMLLLPVGIVHADAGHGTPRADSHAPIGVMGEHVHEAGELMVSYRYMRMAMAGNRIGTERVSPESIVQNVPNRFAGQPMQPPTLRVVPLEMTMEMHMLGAMVAPTDRITLMAMVPVLSSDMTHVTFAGGMGTERLGRFETTSSGIGDVGLSALFRVRQWADGQLVGKLGVRLPTGDVDDTDTVLSPMDTRPELRLPYPMQTGSGTFALTPGLTWRHGTGAVGWGAQYAGTLQLGRNDEGYSRGNEHVLSAWGSYLWAPWISTSVRAEASTRARIDGIDSEIRAPVQTANPDFQGGDRVDAGIGVNLLGTRGALAGHRVAVEYMVPVHQDLNGPQLETDSVLTVGYQYAW